MGKITIRSETVIFKHLTGGWSKYGGRRYDAIANQWGDKSPYWYCQVCGQKQPTVLSPIKIPIENLGYIRICPACFIDDKYKNIHSLPEDIT